MKIAIITETFLPSTDGIVTRLTACITWLLDQGHEVRIYAPDLGVYEYKGAKVIGLSHITFPFYRSKQFAVPHPVVKKHLKEFNPDVVHVVNPAVVGYAGIKYARQLNLPLVASYHTNLAQYMDYYKLGSLKWLMWWHFRRMHNQADINLCTSQTVKDELVSRNFERMHLWKRGVNTEQFSPDKYSESMRRRLTGGQPEKTLLLYVGRLAAEKEIEKVRHVLEESDTFVLAIVGDGPHRQALEEHFKGTNTIFTGFMHGEELAETFATSDVFVFPSTTETLGLVIMEAMASGVPLVAAQSGPTREQIEDGKTGLLYEPNVEGDFTRTVLRFEDELLRKKMADQAHQDVQSFSWNQVAEQIEAIYEQAVSGEKPAESKEELSGS